MAAFRVLSPSSDAPVAARRTLDELDGLDGDERNRLALLVSELVTNSVRHARLRDGETVSLAVSVGERIRLEVTDPGPGFDPAREPERANRDNGWGLMLVDALATRWGVERDTATRVWLELERAASEPGLQPSSRS